MPAMLPWRRSKFVLVDEGEGKGKGKSFGPALSYAALLSSFVRSCPDLWAECPLERLGGLFRHRRRQKVELNKEDPSYTAWYLGNAVTLQAKGEGCTHEAVEKIWAKSEFGGRSTKMKLTLGPHGIRMGPCEKKGARRPSHAYLLHRITYCAADARHPKVFAWVYRHQVKNKAVVLRCHAVMLSKPEKAQGLAVLLYQTSLSAFNEFKRLKRQSDSRHVQQQLLGEAMVPLAPLRKILNCKCPYRPPADRNRSAPRLSAIQEEEEEEEKGEREEKNRQASIAGSGSSGDANRILAAMIARTGSQSLARTSPVRSMAILVPCVRQSDRAATDTLLVDVSEDSQPRDKMVAGRLCKRANGPERLEVRGLARDMRFCTLRAPTPPMDTPTWDSPKGASCSPC